MTLKFSRNVLVYGEHRAQGSIHEIKDSDANLLITDGAAVRFSAPEKAQPETADLKPAKETAARGKAK